jgi:RIO-like serine/threonine protein kinase
MHFCSPQHTDSALYPIISQMERDRSVKLHRPIRILFLGLGKAEENANARNDTHHYSDIAANRRVAELGLFKGMGATIPAVGSASS